MGILSSLVIAASLLLQPALAANKVLTVAVIDTGIDPSVPNLCHFGHKSFTYFRDPLVDNVGHGTHVAGIINQNADLDDHSYCLVSIKFYDVIKLKFKSHESVSANMRAAIQYAINIKVDFINISGGGVGSDPSEQLLIKKALDMGIKVIVAAGNESADLTENCNYFPACYDKRIVVVGNLNNLVNVREPSSNYGSSVVNRWEVGTEVLSSLPGGKVGTMTGTSQATGVATGKILRARLLR